MIKMKKLRFASVIGARPQFIKAAPLELEMSKWDNVEHFSIHTGQHYDDNMSKIFFDELGLKEPYCNLNCGSGSHAAQTASIMVGLENVLSVLKPDVLIVYGDTNSTLAGALVASKMHIAVAHIEAGLRSFNKAMPEEVNRILTDHASDLLFAPTVMAAQQLSLEGLNNVFVSGDIMLDMLEIYKKNLSQHSQIKSKYYYATIHRPYNTDDKKRLLLILDEMNKLDAPVYFSLHPRTGNMLRENYLVNLDNYENIKFIPPQSYFDNMDYLIYCDCLITDSGGMQKEAYFLNKKCITIRSETEWTETLENNCNVLVWDNISDIPDLINRKIGLFKEGIYGYGLAANTIVKELIKFSKKVA